MVPDSIRPTRHGGEPASGDKTTYFDAPPYLSSTIQTNTVILILTVGFGSVAIFWGWPFFPIGIRIPLLGSLFSMIYIWYIMISDHRKLKASLASGSSDAALGLALRQLARNINLVNSSLYAVALVLFFSLMILARVITK